MTQQIHGTRQLKDSTVSDGKLAVPYVKADGTRAFTGNQSMGGFKITNLAAPSGANDAARMADLGGGPVLTGVPVFESNVTSTTYATSGIEYLPVAKNASPEHYFAFDGNATRDGNVVFDVIYAMSVSNGGDIALQVDYVIIREGDDPNETITVQSPMVFTPGTGTTRKTLVGDYDSETISMSIAVLQGDYLKVYVTRKNVAGDTHTGTMNILGVRPK